MRHIAVGPNRYPAFYAALFASDFQPKKKPDASADRTNADLAELAQKTGAPSIASDCITSGQRIAATKDEASKAENSLKRLSGANGIPKIFEGTREVDYDGSDWIDNLR